MSRGTFPYNIIPDLRLLFLKGALIIYNFTASTELKLCIYILADCGHGGIVVMEVVYIQMFSEELKLCPYIDLYTTSYAIPH